MPRRTYDEFEGGYVAVDDYEAYLIEEVLAEPVSRSELLRRATVAGLSVTALSALLARSGRAATIPTLVREPQVAAQKIKRGGIGRLSSAAIGVQVDPVRLDNPGGIRTVQIAAEYLVVPRADYSLKPRLATSWSSNTKADEWTFTIRRGVRFHDGSAMGLDDVIATFNRLTDPAVNSAALSAFRGILSPGKVERVGRDKVRFHLDRPYSDFPYLVSAFNYNSVILPANYEIGDFAKGGVGSGPFVLKEFSTERVRYERNPRYWRKGLPYLNGVVLQFFGDAAAQSLALQGGAIDVFSQVPSALVRTLRRNRQLVVQLNPSSTRSDLQMRVDTAPFDDKRVRQAIAYCIDRDKLNELTTGGLSGIGNDHGFAPIFPVSALARKEPQRKQDYNRARRLLAEAGHARGFAAKLITVTLDPLPQYAVVWKEQLKPVGIDVTLDILTPPAFFGGGSRSPSGTMAFGIQPWGARGTASQLIEAGYKCDSFLNTPRWCNRQFNITMDRLDATVDEKRRRRLALRAARLMQDKTPAVIPLWGTDVRAWRRNVRGLTAGPATIFIDVSEMWLA